MSVQETILEYSNTHVQFSLQEISSEVSSQFDIVLSTIRWHLSQMVKKGVLKHISQGIYSSCQKENFVIESTDRLNSVYAILKEAYPLAPFCLYEGHVFERLQQHLSYNNLIYVETDKFIVDEVFDKLVENGYKVYMKPDKDFMYKYVDMTKDAVIVRNLISQSPLNSDCVPLPTIEKLLVDIPKEKDLFYLQDAEYQSILENAIQNYAVDKSRLLRYAGRRGYKEEMEERLKHISRE